MRNRATSELDRAMEARVPDYRDHHKFPIAHVIFPCPPVVNAELNRPAHSRWRTILLLPGCSSSRSGSSESRILPRELARGSRDQRTRRWTSSVFPTDLPHYFGDPGICSHRRWTNRCLSFSLPFPPHLIHLSLSLRIPSVCTLNAHRSHGRSIRAAATTYPASFDKTRLIHSRKFTCRKQRHTAFPRHVALFPLNESSIR